MSEQTNKKQVTVEYHSPFTSEDWKKVHFEFPEEALAEMRDVFKQEAADGMVDSLDASITSGIAYIDGKPIFIYGVTSYWDVKYQKELYNVWGFSSKEAMKYPKTMVEAGRDVVNKLRAQFGWMFAWCDPRYKRSMKWLDMIGVHDTGWREPIADGGLDGALLETDKPSDWRWE